MGTAAMMRVWSADTVPSSSPEERKGSALDMGHFILRSFY